LIFFHGKDDLGSTAERGVDGIALDGEMATGLGLPDVLLVVVVLGDNSDFISNEVGGIEAETGLELPKDKKRTRHRIDQSSRHPHRLGSFA
jgi:hypothetical protein